MDANTFNGIVRAAAPALVAYLVGRGVIPAADYAPVIAGLTATVAAVWSIWSNRKVVTAPSA